MAKNDFSAETAENYEQKCLCVLVLDVSGSMRGTPIAELNKGLQDFYKDIKDDETSSHRLELCIMTFADKVTTLQEPALVENFTMPTLTAYGSTVMVDAVNEAIDKVEARKAWYKETNQPYYRPWIILMTDGEPNRDQDVESLAKRIKSEVLAKKYAFLPIGVDGANMEVLQRISGEMGALKLRGTRFAQFFKWLSASMGTITKAEEGSSVNLSAGAFGENGWIENFKI